MQWLKNLFSSSSEPKSPVESPHLAEVSTPLDNGIDLEKQPKRNQINAIKPYMWNGLWVFDDPAVGLDKEALIAGMPEMILHACAAMGITSPEKGFLALFSKDPFPGAKICLQWLREEGGGNAYFLSEANIEGWLCPALFKYFDEAPKQMYIELRPVPQS